MNEPTMFDPNKPVRTRDGKPARIKATDVRTRFGPRIVAIVEEEGYEEVRTYAANGTWLDSGNSGHDLVNVPEKRKVTVAFTRHGPYDNAYIVANGRQAFKNNSCVIAVKEVEFVEGEGLRQSEGM